MVRPCDMGHRASRRVGLPHRLQSAPPPGVEGTMTEQHAPIVVKPGTVDLDDLARVLEGASVVLDPSFWPGVEGAAEIFGRAAGADAPVYGINTGFGKLASKRI